ncbi:trypsin-like serine protease [Maribacter sp. 2210JD10-5]|uniref:trypsin-like serine protease n=1 Tax=Maribacter sp. 2210JD10-5 TaxID=3386272 RepID=UPI0039BD1F72
MKVGNWSDIEDGDLVYTSGYPHRRNERVTAKGMFSTKYQKRVKPKYSRNDSIYEVEAARLDLTVNNGNSGGPLIRLGKSHKRDIVVGLISFKLNPNGSTFGEYADLFYRWANDTLVTKTTEMKDVKLSLSYLYRAAANNSLGVSGAVTIDGLEQKLKMLNQ